MWVFLVPIRTVVGFFNYRSTEKNGDIAADLQIQTEQNNSKAILWAIATVVVGLLF